MSSVIVPELIGGLALLLSLAFLQSFLGRIRAKETRPGQALSGVLFGIIVVIGMTPPFHPMPGAAFDTGPAVVGIAGFWGGPIVALISAAISGLFRLWLGGGEVLAGVTVLASSAFLGLAFRYMHQRSRWRAGFLHFLGFGLLIYAVALGWYSLLPSAIDWRARKWLLLSPSPSIPWPPCCSGFC